MHKVSEYHAAHVSSVNVLVALGLEKVPSCLSFDLSDTAVSENVGNSIEHDTEDTF